MSEAKWVGEVPHIHEHTHSVYTLCLECKSWGINLPSETRCGNCSSESGILYVPRCCVRAAYAAGRSSRDGLRKALEEIRQIYWGISVNGVEGQIKSAFLVRVLNKVLDSAISKDKALEADGEGRGND